MNYNPIVSIVIPTRNSAKFLTSCIKHIKDQTYKNIEIIVVDSRSTDTTPAICKKYHARLLQFDNSKLGGRFDATFKRNMGAKNAKGEFVYYLDADFELAPRVIESAVYACTKNGYDAVIVKEVIRGDGFWTKSKALEQECYWGDNNVEAPRFFKKTVWGKLGGLDENLGAGCDDWDLYQRFLIKGYKATRISPYLIHNEGRIYLLQTAKKAFLYGKDVPKFVNKNPRGGFIYFFPIRPAYIRNWRLFLKSPDLGIGLIILRCVEYFAGAIGAVASYI